MISDPYGRAVTSLRIQLNTVCNFKCFFCHMEGTGINSASMSLDELESLARMAARFGIGKIKFTGGEPTLRRDIVDIVRVTRKHIDGEISMTTNGTRLRALAGDLKDAGLDRINISLHSIDREGFSYITGTDSLDQVLDGIRAAQDAGLGPIKLNFVVLNGINVDQIEKMVAISAREDIILQLIEYEVPRELENSDDYRRYHYPLDALENNFSSESLRTIRNSLHDRPQYYLRREEGIARVEVVQPMRNYHFCDNCTRMRVTSAGYFKPCLMRSDNYTRFIDLLRNRKDDDSLDNAFRRSVKTREPYWKREDTVDSQVLCEIPGSSRKGKGSN